MKIFSIKNDYRNLAFNAANDKIVKVIVGGNGLHCRPASIIAKEAQDALKKLSSADAYISITKEGSAENVDASSIFGIMCGVFSKGTNVKVKASENFPQDSFSKIVKVIENPELE